jgi:hypothetical protein
MKHAVLALILGAFAYIAVMATAPIGMVLDADYWRERRDIALIGVVALFGLVMWAALFLPPGSGLNDLASALFESRSGRRNRHGFAAYLVTSCLSFSALATAHLAVIAVRKRLSSSST